jgi:hypothetical protein
VEWTGMDRVTGYEYSCPARISRLDVLQGLTWFECCAISKEELVRRFMF